jgi:hypothetical protein
MTRRSTCSRSYTPRHTAPWTRCCTQTSLSGGLYAQFVTRAGVFVDRPYVWRALCNARKARKLVRKEC